VYVVGGALQAVPFDLRRLEVRGPPVTLERQVATTLTGAADFAIAPDGTLAYVSASPGARTDARTLVWVNRDGQETPITAPAHPYLFPRLSPDGTRIAIARVEQERDIWIVDLARTSPTRLTFDPALDLAPSWTSDGRSVIFQSARGSEGMNLWRQAADGSGKAERLTTSEDIQEPTSMSGDGSTLIFTEVTQTSGFD
jgi:Tol biopolymer transport system component